jgi:hypothetical protein
MRTYSDRVCAYSGRVDTALSLMERGGFEFVCEIGKIALPQQTEVQLNSLPMEHRPEILRIIKQRLERAQTRRREAGQRFEEALKTPSGIQGADGALLIRAASQEYSRTLADLYKAIEEQNNFLLHGVIPQDLSEDEAPAP